MKSNIMIQRAGPKPSSNCSDHFPAADHGVRRVEGPEAGRWLVHCFSSRKAELLGSRSNVDEPIYGQLVANDTSCKHSDGVNAKYLPLQLSLAKI